MRLRNALFLFLLTVTAFAPILCAQLAPPPQARAYAIAAGGLELAVPDNFVSGGTFTVEGWIYVVQPISGAWIMGRSLSAPFGHLSPNLFGVYLHDRHIVFNYSNGSSAESRAIFTSEPIPLFTWVHVAAVMDGPVARLLINGKIIASGPSLRTPGFRDTPFVIGSSSSSLGSNGYHWFPGYGSNFRLWTTARTAAEIASAASTRLPQSNAGLFAAWDFALSADGVFPDLSGNNHPLPARSDYWQSASMLAAAPFFDTNVFIQQEDYPVARAPLDNVHDFALIDFDSDGDLDIVTTAFIEAPFGQRSPLRAFRNNAGRFTDVTTSVIGDVDMIYARHHLVADFNRDGRSDLFLAGFGANASPFPGEQSRLLIQGPDGRLNDESPTRLPPISATTHHIATADIDRDGDLDIYMANIGGGTIGPVFYINDGTGKFSSDTSRLPAEITARTANLTFTSAVLIDVDGDLLPDLVLGGNTGAPNNVVLLNDGTGRFTRYHAQALPPKLYGLRAVTTDIAAADFNGDGATDLVFSTTGGQSTVLGRPVDGYKIPGVQLLLNRGDGTFRDASNQLTADFYHTDTWIRHIRVTDIDGDGHMDLGLSGISGNGFFILNTIYRNYGAGIFRRAPITYDRFSPHTFQFADLDRDGQLDILSATSAGITVARALKRISPELFASSEDAPGRLANLSVRTQAGTGDQTLITGFALGGAGTKSLLVRAVGPTLSAFGLTGTLPDPFVEIAPLNAAKVTENNNWSGTAALKSAFASVGAFALATNTSLDAALVFAPSAGAYTAKITDTANRTGLALVEIYDTGNTNTPKLTNVSARTQVGTGADALIVGFVVSGNVPKKFLIRAVGPTLGAFGVGGTLADPVLDVRPLGSENIVATNDDWRGTPALKAAFTSVGAFALAADTSLDAALAIELPPGAYTATVSGKQNTIGVALVEVYELP